MDKAGSAEDYQSASAPAHPATICSWLEQKREIAVPSRATELLRVVHARPGVTRADAARLIGVGTGATTELVGRLGQAELLAEGPTAPSGSRGRPTTALIPHPRGPLIAAASITHESWRVDVVELGGAAPPPVRQGLGGPRGDEGGAAVGAPVGRPRTGYGDRLRRRRLPL